MSFPYFGSISHGTMREEDLIPTFADVLKELARKARCYKKHRKLIQDAEAIDFDSEDYDQDQASEVLSELFDALNEFSPPYFYFGAHPGDGSDYGFWLCEDWQQAAADSEAPIVSDSSELPKGYCGEWFSVTDHGNVTMYVRHRNHQDREIWAIV